MAYKTVVNLARAFAQSIRESKCKEEFLFALQTQDWAAIRELKADPNAYTEDERLAYRNDAQLCSFLRKLDCLPGNPPEIRKSNAIETFFEGEKQNYRTNLYLHRILHYPVDMTASDLWVRDKAFIARKWIKKVLGPIPDTLDGRFGPGNVAECDAWPDVPVSPYSKVVYPPAYTENFSAPLRQVLVEDTAWGRAQLFCWSGASVGRRTRGARSSTVPKDGKTNRFIGIEPGMNLFAQLAIGGYFKTRLNKIGIRMRPGIGRLGAPLSHRYLDGQEFHRQLAREGSSTGRFVTLDLSNASNLNAKEAVRFLFSDWAELMDEVRSPAISINGRWYNLEMYSAMGNGFTFEVLTIMMLAIAYAAGYIPGLDAFAYGDDVILENDSRLDSFIKLLTAFGHKLNTSKSFTNGPFRESCGGDYWRGHDVRPVVVDKVPAGPLEWMELYNLLQEKGFLTRAMRKIIIAAVPQQWRAFGPPGVPGVFATTNTLAWKLPRRSGKRPPNEHQALRLMEDYNCVFIKVFEYVTPKARLFPAAREPNLMMLLGAMGIPLNEVGIRGKGKPSMTWRAIPNKVEGRGRSSNKIA